MISDPHFDEVIAGILSETIEEIQIVQDIHHGRGIESPAIIAFCYRLAETLPVAYQELLSRDPAADYLEGVLGVTQVAWDYGFRAGRIFQARGHEVPGEDFEENE